jgi:hypothetical protein
MNNLPRARYWLRSQPVLAILDRYHLTHTALADALGLSKSHWSQLVNRHKPLTPSVRRALLDSRFLRGVPERELFDVEPPIAA